MRSSRQPGIAGIAPVRQLFRRLRQGGSKRVFTVRRWHPEPALRSTKQTPLSRDLAFDVLWHAAPPKYTRVETDGPFEITDNFPVPGSIPLPLLDVRARSGEPYLSIAACPVTGAVFHRRLPPPGWQAEYYATAWDRSRQDALPAPKDLLRERTDKVARLLGSRVRSGMRVLDVGCGYGDQLVYFKRRGCEVLGVEPSRHRAEYAYTRFEIPVLNCAVGGAELGARLSAAGGEFDLIYLNQVLEHLNDPIDTLRLLRPSLGPHGRLLLGVPDLFSDSLATYCTSIVHTHSFSSAALRNYAAIAGYRATEDLSFPGYQYWLFEPATGDVPLIDPRSRRVTRYLAAHFGLSAEPPPPGSVMSVLSSYTGDTELGLRIRRAPVGIAWRHYHRALGAGRVDELQSLLPIVLNMPVERPTLWQK